MASSDDKFVRRQQQKLYFKNILRKIFLEDWVMKLVALVITFALWIGVTGLSKPTIQRISGVPLTLTLSSNTDVTNTPIQEVDIVISGDKRKIDQIIKNDLVVSLDLTDVQPGDRVIQLMPGTVSLSLPTGIKLDEIQPRQIAVKLEPVEVKEVPVNAATEGSLPEGFEVYGQTISPQKVRVRGPANLMRALASVTTDKIDLTGKNADFTARQVSVNVSNPKATLLETLVDITFRIGEKRIERSYSVSVTGDGRRKINVLLYGGKSLLDGLKPEDITVEMVKDPSGNERLNISLPSSLAESIEIRRPRPES